MTLSDLSDQERNFSLPKQAVALVLAGGRGSRLMNLTDRRAKPAVYFGGKFRIIDFALSNCLNSGIRRIGVITQYKSHSLLRHLQRGWAFMKSEMNEFVDLLPAQQRNDIVFHLLFGSFGGIALSGHCLHVHNANFGSRHGSAVSRKRRSSHEHADH